jgi:hypothetical protein
MGNRIDERWGGTEKQVSTTWIRVHFHLRPDKSIGTRN